jgi:hypothetical protein
VDVEVGMRTPKVKSIGMEIEGRRARESRVAGPSMSTVGIAAADAAKRSCERSMVARLKLRVQIGIEIERWQSIIVLIPFVMPKTSHREISLVTSCSDHNAALCRSQPFSIRPLM